MIGTETNGMAFAIMTAVYARKAKHECGKGATQLFMYAFYDAMERTALSEMQVLDAKRSPREAFDNLVDYAKRLEEHLDESGDEETSE